MPQREPRDHYIDALRISERDQAAILSRLEEKATKFDGGNRRGGLRHRYRVNTGLLVEIAHPGGSISKYLVRPRDLSSQGMSFLHGSFLHRNSVCKVILETLQNQPATIPGRVVRCEHVNGRAHDIGVRFDAPVDLSKYLTTSSSSNDPSLSAEIKPLKGAILFLEDALVDRELMRFQLRDHEVTLEAVESLPAALEQVAAKPFDIAVIDADITGTPGKSIIEALRGKGHTGPIIAVTADDTPESLAAYRDLIRVTTLTKPYTLDTLLNTLGTVLTPPPSAEPILSEMWFNTEMRPLISTFVHDLHDKIKLLEQHVQTGAMPSAQHLLLDLKGAAGGFGFGIIQQAARDLHMLMKTQDAAEGVKAKLADLSALADAALKGVQNAEQDA